MTFRLVDKKKQKFITHLPTKRAGQAHFPLPPLSENKAGTSAHAEMPANLP